MDGAPDRRARQMPLRMLQEIAGTAERRDHAGKPLRRGTGRNGVFDRRFRRSAVRRQTAQHQHLGAERHGRRVEARLAPGAGQIIDHIGHLEGIAGRGGERLVHVGEERRRRQAGAVGDENEAVGEGAGIVDVAHEGAGAELHVHD